MNHTLEQIPRQVARLADLRADAGRDGPVEITIGGTPADLGEVTRYADAGVGRVIVRPWQRSRDAVEALRRYADEVVDPAAAALAG
jgi:hypothetical protein